MSLGIMDTIEENNALPFDVYEKFLGMIKGSDAKMYEYLGELGFLINDEKLYEDTVSKNERPESYERHAWKKVAKVFRLSHLVDIDIFYSELKFLSDRTIREGTILFGGCSNGDTMEWVKRNTAAKVIGLDYVREMLSEYKGGCKADVVFGDCGHIPLPDGSVNQVILAGILPRGNIGVLKESKRVLTPGGEVVSAMRVSTMLPTKGYRGYAEATRDFLDDRNFKRTQSMIRDDMETLDCTNKATRNLIWSFVDAGLTPRYEFSCLPLIPRAHEVYSEVEVPMAIIGKKPLPKV